MSLTQFSVDDGPHSMDGLRLSARDGSEPVEALVGRKVMDIWVASVEHRVSEQSLFRGQYNRAWQTQSCIDRAHRQRKVPARCRVQPPAPLCRSSGLGHRGQRRDPSNLSELVRSPCRRHSIGWREPDKE